MSDELEVTGPLVCANGSRWTRYACGTKRDTACKKCRAESARAIREFDLDVLMGKYDIDGYKPGERRAQ